MRAPPDLRDLMTRPDDNVAQVWPLALSSGWHCVTTPSGACATPADCPNEGWLAADVPGTVASAWRAAGRLNAGHPPRFAYDDHWYRVALSGHGHRRLRLHGLASITEVWLDGTLILRSDSMFEAHDIDIELNGTAALALCFRSITPALEARRSRARWRPRLVSPPTLRNVRTTLLGHMPGWCPPLQAAGPWRPVELLGGSPHAFDTVDLSSRVEGNNGVVSLTLTFIDEQISMPAAQLTCGGVDATLAWRDKRTLTGSLRVPNANRWWPHTHGVASLYDVALKLGDVPASIGLGRVGFRTIEVDRGADGEGFGLIVNGVPVFCRGACWTTADLVTLAGTPAQLEHAFALARDAGMNMLRVGGTMVYESDAFYALADRFGILIWQDFAFANFDYPTDESFTSQTTREASQFLARTRRFASLAVLCGGSEVDQQAAMFGLPPALRAQPLFTERLPAIVAAERPDVPYVVNSPSGGTWPFSTRRGVTHYYGVGAYMRPLDDARRAQVRFAAECLALANVPDDATLHNALGTIQQHDPRWKAAVPRDPGSGWDFDDVRDHYLHTLYGVEPARLRYEDPQRYLDLSRAVVAEVMTDVFAEWRRHGASCRGALVWQFQDLRAGAGWGIVDATGRPKSVWHALARTLQPVQLLITDEGLDGLDLHLINETDTALKAQLEIVSLRAGVQKVASATVAVELSARSTQCLRASDCLGQFFDLTHAYRFGPRSHDVTIATLFDASGGQVLSEAFHLPDRRVESRHDIPMEVALEPTEQGWQLVIEAHRFARAVHVVDPRFRAARDVFHLAPNRPQTIQLIRLNPDDTDARPQGELRAINALAPVFYG
ncbi:glycosyl hydrolase 2 galactose-binding domain-containing protein [Paraburkholderia sp. GAS334]|uniref:glycosyl hydrolase 2 galactose-binding domain-containing protein n=1 Tax=Paraburkholderia sp. GAS334 TaxID=3035131 RepID=UPI003D1CBC72